MHRSKRSRNYTLPLFLCDSHAGTAGSLDLFFCTPGEELCLDDECLAETRALTQNLVVSRCYAVDHRDLVCCTALACTVLRRDERRELVNVDSRAKVLLPGQVEVSHTDLTEVTRVTEKGEEQSKYYFC